MRTLPPAAAAALAVLGLSSAAFAQGTPQAGAQLHFAPGQTISYEQAEMLWGPGSEPIEPFRIVGNVYYVGARNIASYLITTPEGHFLIDTGTTRMTGSLGRNIEKLGFKLSDVRVILETHAHVDHIEAHAFTKRITGAAVMAMHADAEAMALGKDLSGTHANGWEPIPIDRVLEDNEELTLGGVTLRAILTPGHTPGNTTWVMTTKDGGRDYQIVFGGAPTPVVGNVVYNTPAELVATSFKRLRELKPDMTLGGHPEGQFRGKLDAIRAGARPSPLLMEAGAWTTSLDRAEAAYKKKLADAKASGTGRAPDRQ